MPKNCASIRLMTKSIVSQHHVPFFFLIFFLKILFQQQRKQQHSEIRDKKQTADGKRKLRENTYWLMMFFFFFNVVVQVLLVPIGLSPLPLRKKSEYIFLFFIFLCASSIHNPPPSRCTHCGRELPKVSSLSQLDLSHTHLTHQSIQLGVYSLFYFSL